MILAMRSLGHLIKKIKEFLLRIINNKSEYENIKKNINLYKKVLSFPFKSNKYIYKKTFL